MEFRANVPVGVGVQAKQFVIEVIEGARAVYLESGHYEGGAHGLVLGLGDTAFNIIGGGYEIEPQGSPDNTVNILKGWNVRYGVPTSHMDELATFNDEDVNTDALASGEAYPVRLSIDETGAKVQTKGVKATEPISEAGVPEVPEGHENLGWLVVPFDATIDADDIHQEDVRYGFANLTGTGLSRFLDPSDVAVGSPA